MLGQRLRLFLSLLGLIGVVIGYLWIGVDNKPISAAAPEAFLCPNLRGKTGQHMFMSQAMGEQVAYLVHLPPCYEHYRGQRALPVLYLLHGWPMDETHWDKLGMDELADDWLARDLVLPFIIVMPGVGSDGLYVNSSGGPGSFEGMVVNELVPLIDQTYETWQDPNGRAIGGISRGGVWSLEIGLRHPHLFGVVGAHSPALGLNRPLPQYNPFLLVQDDRPGQRFYLDAGDKDWAHSSTIQFRDVLMQYGVDVTYHVHIGGHVDSLWQDSVVDYLSFYVADWR
jgi:enterochelin esterase-like enzyme